MEDFIKNAASKLGIGESESRSATGGILNLIKGQLGDTDFSAMLGKLPGADALVSEAGDAAAEDAGSGLGGMLGKATSMLGGGGGAADIMGLLGKSGLSLDNAGSFVTMFMDYLKDKVGGDLFDKIKGVLPDLTPGD